MSEPKKLLKQELSKQEKLKLIQELSNSSMRQTAILYSGILLMLVIAVLLGNYLN